MNTLIVLAGLGVLALFSEILNFKKYLFPFVLIGLAAAFFTTVRDWNTNISYYNNMMTFDNYAVAFTAVIVFVAFLWFLLAPSFFDEVSSRADHFALVLFALVGGVVMISYSNMVMLFLGIEILSISMYILAGSRKNDPNSNEAALKYFLMGAFATGFLLFGIALIYGATGSFHIGKISEYLIMNRAGLPAIFFAGVILMLVGLAFKISAVPFHFWTPDVYQGSPDVITAFMATIVKTAAIAAFFRLFFTCFSSIGTMWSTTIWALAALTIIVGNLTAVYQTNLKRMLAYSSISHAGYMLLAILAMNTFSIGSVLFYTLAYSISTIAAFTVLLLVVNTKGNSDIRSFSGLAKNNPFMAFVMTVAMLSLAGIPPTAGFFAKYYIFAAALQSNYIWLVIIAVLGSLIGVYYYFRVIIAMYQAPLPSASTQRGESSAQDEGGISLSLNHKILLVITAALAVLFGVLPDLILGLLNS